MSHLPGDRGQLNAGYFTIMMDPVGRRFEEWDKDLSLVRAAAREASVAELALRHRVSVARRNGHSWAAIGFVLGIPEQETRVRFGQSNEESA